MSNYNYKKLNLSDDKSTSYEDLDINDVYLDKSVNRCSLYKKLKIKYTYTHYTNYAFYKKLSK